MNLRLRNILLVPALFFSISEETTKAKADESVIPNIRKDKFNKKVLDQTDIIFENLNKHNWELLPQDKAEITKKTLEKKNNPAPKTFLLKKDEDSETLNPATITFLSLLVAAVIIAAARYRAGRQKDTKELSDKEIKKLMEDVFQDYCKDFSDPIVQIRRQPFIARNVSPEEKSNLELVYKILSYSQVWNDLISDDNITIVFKKNEDIVGSLSKQSPIRQWLMNANYPSYPFRTDREELKLNSFTFIGTENLFEGDKKIYTIAIEDYKDLINLLFSAFHEVHRIKIYEYYSDSNFTLAELQMESYRNSLENIQSMHNDLAKDPAHKPICNLFLRQVKKAEKQLDGWESAHERYLAEVNSSPSASTFLRH